MPHLSFTRVLVYLFLGLATTWAAADECGEERVMALFQQAATDGLIVEGTPADHELATARQFGAFLARDDQSLALVSTLGRVNAPAFDGVALDEDRRPLANVSLKGILRPNAENLGKVVGKAFRTMEDFSECRKWVHHVRREAANRAAAEMTVRYLMALYGPGENRRQWLVIDTYGAPKIDASVLNYVAGEFTKKDTNRRIFLLNDGKIFEMHKGQWWDATSCAATIVKWPQI